MSFDIFIVYTVRDIHAEAWLLKSCKNVFFFFFFFFEKVTILNFSLNVQVWSHIHFKHLQTEETEP